jgi:hypothetical protein
VEAELGFGSRILPGTKPSPEISMMRNG